MKDKNKAQLDKESYKGVRDFYPEDQYVQNYIFAIWRETLNSFGYEEYNASILESADLYKAKTGEEIVNEQTYTFTDRGDREVTLRPEMTPTVARMIARKKRELTFPVRWFSIPNLFRYERPQRGRLREHWQLNADIFGIKGLDAEAEMIEIAYTLMMNFGLEDTQFEIRINDRQILNAFFESLGVDEITKHKLSKLLDKKNKIDDFDEQVEKLLGKKVDFDLKENETIEALMQKLENRGISNVVFDSSIMRGFDYYTGVIFEVFDTSPHNNRSLFGGGRYDDLLAIFDEEKVPAVGFGQGDVTMKDVLETYELLPTYEHPADVYICNLNDAFFEISAEIAGELRQEGFRVMVDYTGKKVGDQLRKADKQHIPFTFCVGEDEVSSNTFLIKDMISGKDKKVKRSKIATYLRKQMEA